MAGGTKSYTIEKRRKNKSIADKVSSKVHEINGKRLESAAKAGYKDADDLRKHGFKEEADAVQKIADNNKEKAAKEREKADKNLTNGHYQEIGKTYYEKVMAKDQKKFDKIKAKTQKLGEKVDSGNADMKTYIKYREQEKKYYKAINELQGKYDLKNVAGVNDYADYRIVGKKDTVSKSKEKYGNLSADIQDYLYANDPKKNQRVEKKISNISKDFHNDKRIKAVLVKDPETGNYTGVLESTLKKKGKNAALKEVKDPEFIAKAKTIEASYIDKYEKEYLSGGMGKEQAHRQAINRFSENTGYTKQSAEDLYKKYSKK